MTTVAAGMESDSDSDCDIVFSSDIKSNNEKTSQHTPSNSSSKISSPISSRENSFSRGNDLKKDIVDVGPPPVIKKMKKNYNANYAYNRQRAHEDKTMVFDDLRFAILQGNLSTTKELYESRGINVDTILKCGWTGLMHACTVGHPDIVEYLLQRHANANFHQDMFTPLMSVCMSKKNEENLLKCCILLLKYHANINVRDRFHTTPLMFATREGHTQIVKLLLEHGADVDAAEGFSVGCLFWTWSNCSTPVRERG